MRLGMPINDAVISARPAVLATQKVGPVCLCGISGFFVMCAPICC